VKNLSTGAVRVREMLLDEKQYEALNFYLYLFRKTNFMKNLLLILALTITSGVLYSQSKKEQNVILANQIDSLNRVLNAEKNTSLEKSNKISDLERTISSLNTNVSKLTTELQKSKAEKEYEIGNLQSQLKSKMDSLQLINTELSRYKNANQVVNIPDANFKKYLIGNKDINTNGDNEIQLSEASSFEGDMDCSEMNISNLKGIEAFTALTKLNCVYNKLTSLDVSKNTALTYLACWENQLTSLDVSKNTALASFWCLKNNLTSLDLSKNTALIELACWGNPLTSLDVSKNTALDILACWENQLTSLDVSKNTALTILYCYTNQLTILDVSTNTALIELACAYNYLTGYK
jgi:hypothetical protein